MEQVDSLCINKANPGQISQNLETQAPQVKYCLYARKSTESEERQALSINSQIKEMLEVAKRDDLKVISILRESHSAKAAGQRPVFQEIIKSIKTGAINGVLTWAPDRLSRNAGDLGELVDLMDQGLLHEIRTFGQKFSNSPNEKFLLMILCSQAKLENDNKGVNVKRGLRAKAEMGLRPGVAPTGYLNEYRTDRKGYAIIDPARAPVIKQIFEKVGNEKQSGRDVYEWLKKADFKTKTGKHLSLSNIFIILKNTFYHGVFEYPRSSGNWYTGQHKPIITKELFELARKQLERDNIVRTEGKEFAFTKLIVCGLCGSGITADEKFKKLKNGSVNRYVYYGCTKSRDKHCKNKYLREDKLIEQLLNIIDRISLDKLGMKDKIEKEIKKYRHFQRSVLGINKEESKAQKEIDMKNYAKYILKEGNIYEQRELLGCLRSKLVLKEREVRVR